MKLLSVSVSPCLSIGVLICLLTSVPAVHGQTANPLARVRSVGLDSSTVGQVTAFFEPGDRDHAIKLAAVLDSAAADVAGEFGDGFLLYLAVLRPDAWFDPYDPDSLALYGMPWGWISESLIAVPASLNEGVLIEGTNKDADLRRVRFVMLHEYGHLAAKRYLHPEGPLLYSSVRWFEEMIATYFAYAFVARTSPDWARAGRAEWAAFVQRDPPSSATLEWRFMAGLPPQEFGRTYAWYQNLLNMRAADVYVLHELAFLRAVRDNLPWPRSNEWTTEMLLPQLDSFAPGFQRWAQQLEHGQYFDPPRR